ncbi:uncharacterized protein LOC129766546 [Toxorhynchites rutilus septentrionalis]|uniref:uncharacterized protein LOC129766546 n=1 Tax=Toxorhynchites rutilus septentrionalis TaxID=329112 RepID=UPI002479D8B4|nr:uncharacterized protein LOC129766546 [Toxorhynchites rutilus septentrionalis]
MPKDPREGKKDPPPQSSCAACQSMHNSRMVACDECDTWYHYECVGVSQDVEEIDWSSQQSYDPQDPLANSAVAPDAHEGTSQEQTSNAIRESSGSDNLTLAQEMKLKFLEEEHALEMKYMARRRQILMETNASCFPEGEINSPGRPHYHSSPHTPLRPDAQEFHPRPSQQAIDLEQSGFYQTLLNRSQIAARQAVSRELPYFDGDPEEWPLFFATFESTTRMCGYTPEENAVRLQKCLRGKAKDSVRSQLLYPGNVNSVIATLKILFGRPEIVIHSLIRKIQALPAPKVDKLGSLIDFAVAVRNMVATVQACELDDYLYNVSLLQELVDRLPPMIKLNCAMHRQVANTRVTLSSFSDWLYSVAEAASSVSIPSTSSADHKQHRGKKDDGYLNAHREQSPPPERKSAVDSCPNACCVCEGSCNKVEKCNKFLGLDHAGRWSMLRDRKLCRRCLNNHRGACRSSSACGVNGCSFKHHRLLHNPLAKPPTNTSGPEYSSVASTPKPPNPLTSPKSTEEQNIPEAGSSRGHNCHTHRSSCKSVLFRYVPVVLYGQGTKVHTHAFLDDRSSLTLLEDDLANELNLEGSPHPICLQWTGDTCRYEDSSRRVSIMISSILNKEAKFALSDVHTVKQLKLPSQTLAFDELSEKYRYLKGLPVDSYQNVRPRILIGINNWRVGHVLESKEGEEAEPIAAKTRLGWMVFGTCSSGRYPVSVHYSYHINCGSSKTDEDLHKSVKEFFSLDSLGIIKSEKPIISRDDERALYMMRSLTTLEEDRYRTGMLWKYDDVRMPNSKSMAMKRLLCLERRMAREPELAKALRHKMNDYVEKGYARKLTLEELEQPRDRIWYLPVFPVFNPNKPGKLRIVWDAAAEVNGVSLNAFLLKGPDQLTELPSVLYKFREHLVAIGGYIREMFHQVQMIEDDQHCLWRTEDAQDEPDVYVLAVMSFGATCSPSCAQFVKNENAERFRSQFPAAVDVIQKAHYVDDMLTSVETEDDAIELAQQVKQIHSHAGFEMRNWVSNSRKVLKAMGEEQVSEKSMDIASELANEKVLGMWWSPSSDTFTYKMFTQRNEKILLEGKRPTKRELLRTMMSIYDPLGMIAHYLMFVKVLLQDVWRSGVSWDECIADREWEKWQTWLRLLPNLESLQIPRCYRLSLSIGLCTNIQLHTFVDSSEEGYAAVCYFRFEERGQVECVGAKSRVAPLKFTSIPRLELQAAVVVSRLASNIQQGHTYNINKRYFWTDARDVLCWLSVNLQENFNYP